jgi:hypothetical protein
MILKSGVVGALGLAAIAVMAPRTERADLHAQGRMTVADSTAPPNEAPVPDSDIARKKGDLSKKLNSTGGVIHPEGSVDPGMEKPAPTVGATPVVPPPGSPGGKPDVQPK